MVAETQFLFIKRDIMVSKSKIIYGCQCQCPKKCTTLYVCRFFLRLPTFVDMIVSNIALLFPEKRKKKIKNLDRDYDFLRD
jgi:hypothetical protein